MALAQKLPDQLGGLLRVRLPIRLSLGPSGPCHKEQLGIRTNRLLVGGRGLGARDGRTLAATRQIHGHRFNCDCACLALPWRMAGGLIPRRECVLTGDEGSLLSNGEVLSFGRRGDSALTPVDIPAHERGAWRVEQDFVDAIRGLAPVRPTTFADGVRYIAFTKAAADSLASGRLHPVEELSE